jgi:hypothetical protein
MGKNYSGSVLTKIWLGSGSRMITRLIHDLNSAYSRNDFSLDSLDLIRRVLEFAAFKYWSQVWIVQEFMLSKDIAVLFGK